MVLCDTPIKPESAQESTMSYFWNVPKDRIEKKKHSEERAWSMTLGLEEEMSYQ